MSEIPHTFENHILRSFTGETLDRLRPHLKHIEMPLGAILYRAYDPITHVYFPERSMISLLASSEKGQNAEIGIIGREGAAGLDVVLGAEVVPYDYMVQMPNSGYFIRSAVLKAEFDAGGPAQPLVLRFIQKLMVQVSQTTMCNRFHLVNARLCRWLLMCHDRGHGDTLRLTHEFLSVMLGVTRVSVSQAAGELQTRGLIRYTRGRITIADRDALERQSCECYRVVKDEYDRP